MLPLSPTRLIVSDIVDNMSPHRFWLSPEYNYRTFVWRTMDKAIRQDDNKLSIDLMTMFTQVMNEEVYEK